MRQGKPDLCKQVDRYPTVALVLQGGGALGGYQCGVYEGLHDAGIRPNWFAGISIGAINAAILAGNAPEDRLDKLRGFWELIAEPGGNFSLPALATRSAVAAFPDETELLAWARHERVRCAAAGPARLLRTAPAVAVPVFGWKSASDQFLRHHAAARHAGTLRRFRPHQSRPQRAPDRRRHRHHPWQLPLFRQRPGKIRPQHIIASGALPPAFPAVEIEGEWYWDGGIVSNTPLEYILDCRPHEDTLVLQVDLWSAHGEAPRTMMDVLERMKDIRFSSRTRHGTQMVEVAQKLRTSLKELIAHLPDRTLPRTCRMHWRPTSTTGCSTSST